MIVMSILMSVVLFVVICFGIGQVAWIYLDAKDRDDRLAIVWAIFAIFPIVYPILLPLPLIIYLLNTHSPISDDNSLTLWKICVIGDLITLTTQLIFKSKFVG